MALIAVLSGWLGPLIVGPRQPYRHQADRDALEQNTALLEQVFTSASVYYAPAYPQFEFYPDAAGFVWQVQALDPEGRPEPGTE